MEDPFRETPDADATRTELLRQDMERLLGTMGGRRLMWSILTDLGAFDPVAGDRAAGRHEAGRELLERAKRANLMFYHTMLQEHDV